MSDHHLQIAHHHIFKCAGTTFATILQHNFKNRVLHVEGDGAGTRITNKDIDNSIRSFQFDALSSHLLTIPGPKENIATIHVVLLRDPIERLQSGFLFHKRNGQAEVETTFEQWLKSRGTVVSSNHQVKFCSQQDWSSLKEAGGWLEDLASIDFDREDLFFGCVEYFDESMVLLEHRAAKLGIALNAAYPEPFNRNAKERKATEVITVANELWEINALDRELVSAVTVRVRDELLRLDPHGRKLKDYRERCAALRLRDSTDFKIPPQAQWFFVRPAHCDNPGHTARIEGEKPYNDTVLINDWGPKVAALGKPFNIQQNGNYTMWIKGSKLNHIASLNFHDRDLKRLTINAEKTLMSIQLDPEWIAEAGRYKISVITTKGDAIFVGSLTVTV